VKELEPTPLVAELFRRGAIQSDVGTLWAACPLCCTDLEFTYDPTTDSGWCYSCKGRFVPGDLAAELYRVPRRGPARRRCLAHMVSVLLGRNVPARLVEELAYSWGATRCVPPLDSAQIRTTVEALAGRELSRRRR
jgi:hypothetical protein